MRYRQILEVKEMDVRSALQYFGYTPSEFNNVTKEQLKDRWKELVKQAHPDNPENRGHEVDVGYINAAHDSLKKEIDIRLPPITNSRTPGNKWKTRDGREASSPFRAHTYMYDEDRTKDYKPENEVPDWQTDKNSTDNSFSNNANPYTNGNFMKYAMHHLSRGSTTKYDLWAFDGTSFTSNITVFGNQKILMQMADAMVLYNNSYPMLSKTRAVFYRIESEPQKLFLIFADGYYHIDQPLMFEYDSPNSNPGNDPEFIKNLPEYLDEIKDEQDDLKN